jgi:hypothetical protein
MVAGMLLAAIPIWLHLRRRDEANLVEFSTLRFLDDQPLARARPLWPDNWPLLLLRLMALALLVAAFAWPYVNDQSTVVVQESRVYILDNTLSHQVDGGFTAAREAVADELARGDIGTQIGVVELASTARTLVRFGDQPAVAASEVRQLEPAAARGNFYEAFRAASELFTTSLGARRRIVLLSDSQANQWTLGQDAPPFLGNLEIDLPAIPDTPPVNHWLNDPRARRAVRDGRACVEAGALLQTDRREEPVNVVIRDRGREVWRQQVRLPDSEPSASIAVGGQWDCDPTQWVLGEISIEDAGDRLAADNRVVFSIPPFRPGRVELLADSLFLRRALDPDVILGRWEVSRTEANQVSRGQGRTVPDVLCLESHYLASAAVREAVRDDLSAGRGVVLIVDDTTPLIAGFLRELGVDAEWGERTVAEPATFRYVFGEHPIFAPLRSARWTNLAEVEFSSYYPLQVRDATALAFSASGDPLIFEVSVGPGRMLLFAFAMDRRDTNWPIHPTFIPFLDQVLQYVRGQSTPEHRFEPGESVVWNLPPSTSAETVVIAPLDPAAPDAAPGDGLIRAEVRDRQTRFQLPARPGHYAVRYGDEPGLAAVLDVNPSAAESVLTYDKDPAALAAWRDPDAAADASAGRESASEIELTRLEALQQPYGWYLLVAAMIVFLAESLFAAGLFRGS